jgi:septum formation topological specificity factor MinE
MLVSLIKDKIVKDKSITNFDNPTETPTLNLASGNSFGLLSLGGNNNIQLHLSIFGNKSDKNLNSFFNKISIKLKNKMYLEEDLDMIHETLKHASFLPQLHNEIINILEKYLSTEDNSLKLQIKIALSKLPFINKKLLKLIVILDLLYNSNNKCFISNEHIKFLNQQELQKSTNKLPTEPLKIYSKKLPILNDEEKSLLEFIDNNLDFIKTVSSEEIFLLKELGLLLKLPTYEEETLSTNFQTLDPNDDPYVPLREQIQMLSLNWDLNIDIKKENITENEKDIYKEKIKNIIDIEETFIKKNELHFFELSPIGKTLSRIYKN